MKRVNMYSFDKKDYEIDGYKIFKPNEIIDAKTIDEISNYFDQKFLKYEDNHTYKNFGINYNDESFEHDKVVYNGFSKNQIYYRGNIKFNSDAVQENILYVNCLFVFHLRRLLQLLYQQIEALSFHAP